MDFDALIYDLGLSEDAERRRRDRDLIKYAFMLIRLDINEYGRKVI